jgi:4a-hydroxytetrahydrobiopterin dehydratase
MTRSVLSRGAAQEGAPGWRYLLGALHLSVDFGSFPAALEFVSTVGRLALPYDHQPDIDIRGSRVHLALTSRADGGVREVDILLANEISALVVYLGHVPDHGRLAVVEVAIDALDREAIAPFWAAVLGYMPDGAHALADPDALLPPVWFQQMDAPRPQRNRIHLDITVPHDEAPRRVAAALAAGGRLVSDDAAPAFWVLADAEGNEACISTWQGRD